MILDSIQKYNFKTEEVPADEIQKNGTILVTEMNAAQSLDFHKQVFDDNQSGEDKDKFVYWMTALCAACMIKDNGEQLVSLSCHKELPNYIPRKTLERIYDVAMRLNGYSKEALNESKKD